MILIMKERNKMSLNFIERINTSKELRQNLKLSHLTIEHVVIDLNSSVQKINQILELDHVSPEDPWILKEYLSNKLQSQGIIGYLYSKLVGDFRDYWFLDTKNSQPATINIITDKNDLTLKKLSIF